MLDDNESFDAKCISELVEKETKRPKNNKVIIYIHGLHGSSKEAQDFKFLKDYDIKGLDYEDGNPWEVGPIVRDKFKELIEPYKEVVVIANSIGAFYTYEYLDDLNINHAFFISPIASMSKIIYDYIFTGKVSEKELKEKGLVTLKDGTTLSYDFYQKYKTRDYHGNFNALADILYGSSDKLVYIENISDYLKEHPLSRLTILSGGGHYLHTKEEKDFIKDWIIRCLK